MGASFSEYDLTFGQALHLAKLFGKRIARVGWNGKGMYVYYVPEGEYESRTPAAKELGETVKYEPYLAFKNIKGTINTWVPSISDVLAEDWMVV